MRQRAFTVLELLVVISIIGLITALLFPAAQYARESARRTQCQNHLKQIGLALLNRHDALGSLPAGWMGNDGGRHEVSAGPGWGWASHTLPYLECGAQAGRVDFHRSFLDEVHSSVTASSISNFRCPSDTGKSHFDLRSTSGEFLSRLPVSNYVGNFGGGRLQLCVALAGTGKQCDGDPLSGLFFHNSRIRLSDIFDGTSQTTMVGERHSSPRGGEAPAGTWIGAHWDSEGDFQRVLGTARHDVTAGGSGPARTILGDFSSRHIGGVSFVYADGHVGLIHEGVDHIALVDQMTRGQNIEYQVAVAAPESSPLPMPSAPGSPLFPFDPTEVVPPNIGICPCGQGGYWPPSAPTIKPGK